MSEINTDTWNSCYDNHWKGLIIDEAFSHPAKFAHGLIRRIYQHAKEEGWLKPGDMVIDPFGGVGLGALYAMKNGFNWVGVELEQKFVNLGRQNIGLWKSQFGVHWPDWGDAVLLQGDSRELSDVLFRAGIEMVVSSPPYTGSQQVDNRINESSAMSDTWRKRIGEITDGESQSQLANLPEGDPATIITSPSFAGNSGGRGEASREGIDAALFDRHSGGMIGGTGDSDENLGNLKHGDFDIMEMDSMTWTSVDDIQTVIGSPPFAESVGSDDPDKRGGLFRDPKRREDVNLTGTYGESEGQLGGMPAGVISSPPYEGSISSHSKAGFDWEKAGRSDRTKPSINRYGVTVDLPIDYSDNQDNIGNNTGETFWSAAALIVQQCYQILPTGGHAIWVVKDFVRNGERVEFSEQWRQLCEAVGFRTCHIHRAMLVKNNGAQASFDGNTIENVTERKSFFRRLHEAYARANVHWQTLSRDDQANNLWTAKNDLWENYYYQLEQSQEEEEPIRKPTKAKILSTAKMIAWTRDGKIYYKIHTSIDWEIVLCMVKI